MLIVPLFVKEVLLAAKVNVVAFCCVIVPVLFNEPLAKFISELAVIIPELENELPPLPFRLMGYVVVTIVPELVRVHPYPP
ncbi:hypothetical protein GCM10022210_23470 [Mucilaginibacter dorajii]|uniref:Uncharacterized protein n=1 Tax=Mucilaginibacter dorajii TaxID=692994 RepID=A0ABP7PX04_9SPHI